MKTITSIKIDSNIKKEASQLAKDMGLNLSSVINASLRRFILEQEVVFSAPKLNQKSYKVLSTRLKHARERKNIVGPFNNMKSLKKSLSK